MVAGLEVNRVAVIMGKRPGTVGCSPTVDCAGWPSVSAPTPAFGGWCNAMGLDDASSADMPRPIIDPSPTPLALDEETVERLLTGDLPPAEAPPGYAKVAAVLAAATAWPTPEEMAGQSAAPSRAAGRDPAPPSRHQGPAGRPAKPAPLGRAGRRGPGGRPGDGWSGRGRTGGWSLVGRGPEHLRTAGDPAPAPPAQPGRQLTPVAPTGDADDPATAPRAHRLLVRRVPHLVRPWPGGH